MNPKPTILIVDDNRNILTTLRLLLHKHFDNIVTLSNPNGIPMRLREDKPDVVLLDMNFNTGFNTGNEGLYWLKEIKQYNSAIPVVLFTAYADIDLAVRGIKEGAADFIVKPFENQKLIDTLLNAARKTTPSSQHTDNKTSGSSMFWGTSSAMKDLRTMVEKVAITDANILITGENGTGKEMLANEIHRLSNRAKGKMLAIDMGVITETLFESELFGHQKGAFTDAKADKPGKFELAEGGTLFLDEIGNLSYTLQAKLLTAIQKRTVMRVGGSKEINIDVRLVCATNKDLHQMVAQGTFREDLLYRINTIHLHLPPLRERKEDIVPLAEIFCRKYTHLYGKPEIDFTVSAKNKLEQLPWHGNIRELQHAIEKAVILCEGNHIPDDAIDGTVQPVQQPSFEKAQTLDDMERMMIEKTMQLCEGNLSLVAARLGISRQTLYNKIKRYGL